MTDNKRFFDMLDRLGERSGRGDGAKGAAIGGALGGGLGFIFGGPLGAGIGAGLGSALGGHLAQENGFTSLAGGSGGNGETLPSSNGGGTLER